MVMMSPPEPEEEGPGPIDSMEIVTHEVPYLYPEDVATVEGIPVTAPARTLLDCATCLEDDELREALRNALTRELTTRAEILACMDRYPDHEGRARLSQLLDDVGS